MKILLAFSMGKDSVMMLGAMLENPSITDICLTHHTPGEEIKDGMAAITGDTIPFIDQAHIALLKHDKIHHIFDITWVEYMACDVIRESINPEEYYLISGENDGPLQDEYLNVICFKNKFKGILNYQYSHDEFIRLYNKYITKTFVHTSHYMPESEKSIQLIKSLVGREYTNTDILAVFKSKPVLRESMQTIIIDSPLYIDMEPYTFTEELIKYICSKSPIYPYIIPLCLDTKKKIDIEKYL